MNDQPQHDPKDAELANEISRRLQNLDIGDLHVSVRGGHATVSGTVDNFSDKRQVTGEIQGFGGIHEVTNLVQVIGESTTMVDSDSNI
jgi:osmotically-inducible protein OsmY